MNAFFSYFVELFFYSDNISADLYQNNIYASSGIYTCFIVLLISGLYYFKMDAARYSGLKVWLAVLVLVFFTAFIVNYMLINRELESIILENYTQEYIEYSLVFGVIAVLMYTIISLTFKRFSNSLSRTPF